MTKSRKSPSAKKHPETLRKSAHTAKRAARKPPRPCRRKSESHRLSFVHSRERRDQGVNFWHVTPSGDLDADHAMGRDYALALAEHIARYDAPYLFGWVVKDMSKGRRAKRLAVDLAFLSTFATLAGCSAARGVVVVAPKQANSS